MLVRRGRVAPGERACWRTAAGPSAGGEPMEPTRWLGAVRTVFRLPRTVRLRLAVLYGVVVLVSGGALLAITFAFGSFQSTKNFAGGCSGPVVNHAPSSCA